MNKFQFISKVYRKVYFLLEKYAKISTTEESSKQPGIDVRQCILMIRRVQLHCLGSNPSFVSKISFSLDNLINFLHLNTLRSRN